MPQSASSDPTEAQPATPTVTVPNGQSSAGFTINGVADGQNDGIQPVILTASAAGHNSATAPLNVTDIDLPDLSVGDIIVPSSGQINAKANITFTVSNPGPVPATRFVVDPTTGLGTLSRPDGSGWDDVGDVVPATLSAAAVAGVLGGG